MWKLWSIKSRVSEEKTFGNRTHSVCESWLSEGKTCTGVCTTSAVFLESDKWKPLSNENSDISYLCLCVWSVVCPMQVSVIPCWMLLGWVNQMTAVLDKPESRAVHDLLISIAQQYPQVSTADMMSGCLECTEKLTSCNLSDITRKQKTNQKN